MLITVTRWALGEGSASCFCVAGTLEVRLNSGETATITADDSYTIPPGHDAHVVGDEKFVGLEFLSAASYAKGD
ncbi:hypothetical protein RBS60_04380 [Sinomonas sp. ASV486]|uniref:hypothetical protein n=1 Tax=Sinomonas sp. ASV486 TaxID=3051170 RepID=UPI0027DBACC2|nr:hypothetical protein [Sinomonas sp. ASV486]MDQ4489435.1 hypothetical protein [Sinomonas sp. ASV486]